MILGRGNFLFVKVPNFGAFTQACSAVIARFNGIIGCKNHDENEHLKENDHIQNEGDKIISRVALY